MADTLFTSANKSNAMLLSLVKRTSGSIPYLRRTIQVDSTSRVKSPISQGVNPLNGNSAGAGQINPYSGLQNLGNNFSFYIQGKIGFSATSNSITLYWDGTNGSQVLVVKRVDNSSFSIPKGSLTISGLNADTIYGFLPFNCLTNQDNLSFCTGDAGTPRFAFSPAASDELKAAKNQTQNLSSNEAITESFIYFTTAPSGTISGEGSPGVLAPYSEVRYPPDSIPI